MNNSPALISATDPCVHCGFCLPTCASYRVLGTEMDSPRGRIHTLKALDAGELTLDATVASHFDSCLGCFACVTACPSGVRYDSLIEATRPKLNAPELRSPAQNAFRRLLFALLPYPQRLRALLQPLRAYAGTPLQGFARRTGLFRLLGPQIAAMEQLLPALPPQAFRDNLPVVVPALGERRYRVGLLLGCVQRLFDPAVSQAAIQVLSANGIEVVIPPRPGLLRRRHPSPGGGGAHPGPCPGLDGQLPGGRGARQARWARAPRCGAGDGLRLRPHHEGLRPADGGRIP